MSRLFPHPVLSLVLLALWLILQQSSGLGHILLGGVLAIIVPILTRPILPDTIIVKRPLAALRLLANVGVDIVRSNFAVFFVLLHPDPKPHADFLEMKLELNHTFGLAILACIITATPGSAWLEYDKERSVVRIHVFDLIEAEEWVKTVKQRYEAPLLEIFQ